MKNMITNLTEDQIKDICKALNIPFVSGSLPSLDEISEKLRDVVFGPYEVFLMDASESDIRKVENAFIMGIVYGVNYR